MTTDLPDVRPGQIWADNDKRSKGRTLQVDQIISDRTSGDLVAVCKILTNADSTQRELDDPKILWSSRDMRGQRVRVKVSRMRPTSTGYRLMQDVPQQYSSDPDSYDRNGVMDAAGHIHSDADPGL
jgi:hypothetical protein